MDIDRKALWVVRELGTPAIVRECAPCGADRHRASGRFRVNASGKRLDVWLLILCQRCGRTAKIPVHERVRVRALDHDRLVRFERNDPATVRGLAMDAALAGRVGYRLDWTGTWELETDLPFYDIDGEDAAPLEVVVRFELPVPVRVENLLMGGLRLSRSAVRRMVDTGRIRLPVAPEAKVRSDFSLVVTGQPGWPGRDRPAAGRG